MTQRALTLAAQIRWGSNRLYQVINMLPLLCGTIMSPESNSCDESNGALYAELPEMH